MAHVILGLLMLYPQSQYDLIKNFEAGASLFYSASSGSIKRALDGLLARGLIEVAAAEPGARGRKVYQVTDAGRDEFNAWMNGELTGSDVETAALSRLYFLGLVEPSERVTILRTIIGRIEGELARFEELERQVATVEIPEEFREVGIHQLATLDYGLDSHRHALQWFREHLARLESP